MWFSNDERAEMRKLRLCSSIRPLSASHMEHLWTLVFLLAGAFLGYFFARLAERSNRRRNTYDEAIRFLAEYRVQATSNPRNLNTPAELLVASSVLDRKIADQFSRGAFQAWRAAYCFISAAGLSSE